MAQSNYARSLLGLISALILVSIAEPGAAQSMRDNENLGDFFKQQQPSRRGFTGGHNDTFDLYAYTDLNSDEKITATEYIKMMENQFQLSLMLF